MDSSLRLSSEWKEGLPFWSPTFPILYFPSIYQKRHGMIFVLCVHVCVVFHVCVHVYVSIYVCLPMQYRGGQQVSYAIALCFILLRRVLLLNPVISDLA